VRKECIPLFEKTTGVTYKENPDTGMFDYRLLPSKTDYCKVSLEFGQNIRKAGYRIMYLPDAGK
jgi:hypothetical protein